MSFPSLSPCVPPVWAPSGHLQTIAGHLLRSPTPPSEGVSLREIPLSDGDRLVASFWPGTSDTVVYLFHGLGGDTASGYMGRTAVLAHAQGHTVYRINHRGCGEGAALAGGPYHSARGDDVSEVIDFGRNQHPGHRHLAIGFSLGGNALLNLVTGKRGTVLPDAAICVNAPIDMVSCSARIRTGFNRVYETWFVHLLAENLKRRHHLGLVKEKYDFGWLGRLHDVDTQYVARHGGFKNAEDYYHQASTHLHLDRISVPTVLLTAQNDPFVPYQSYAEATRSKQVHLHLEPQGGHMGYLSRSGSIRWLDYALTEYLRALEKKT